MKEVTHNQLNIFIFSNAHKLSDIEENIEKQFKNERVIKIIDNKMQHKDESLQSVLNDNKFCLQVSDGIQIDDFLDFNFDNIVLRQNYNNLIVLANNLFQKENMTKSNDSLIKTLTEKIKEYNTTITLLVLINSQDEYDYTKQFLHQYNDINFIDLTKIS